MSDRKPYEAKLKKEVKGILELSKTIDMNDVTVATFKIHSGLWKLYKNEYGNHSTVLLRQFIMFSLGYHSLEELLENMRFYSATKGMNEKEYWAELNKKIELRKMGKRYGEEENKE